MQRTWKASALWLPPHPAVLHGATNQSGTNPRLGLYQRRSTRSPSLLDSPAPSTASCVPFPASPAPASGPSPRPSSASAVASAPVGRDRIRARALPTPLLPSTPPSLAPSFTSPSPSSRSPALLRPCFRTRRPAPAAAPAPVCAAACHVASDDVIDTAWRRWPLGAPVRGRQRASWSADYVVFCGA